MAEIKSLKKAGVKGTFWNFMTSVTGQLRNFIVSLVLARLLPPSDFGLISMALVFNGVLDTLIDFGFSNAIIQKKDVTQEQKSTVFYINISIGIIFTLIIYLCAPLMASFFKMPELDRIVKFTSFSFILGSLGTIQNSLFQKELNFKSPFRARFISSLFSGVIGIIMALYGCGVWSLVVSNLISWGGNSIILWIQSSWKPSKDFNLKSVSSLWDFGWKLTATTIFNRIFKQIDTFVIGRFYSATSLGLFNRAQSLNYLVVDYSFSSIRNVLLPTFSKIQDDTDKFRYSVLKLMNIICFLNFLFSGIMYVSANNLITLLYGDDWKGAISIFKILAFFSLNLSLPIMYDTIMSSLAKMTLYFNVGLLRKPLLILAIPIGIYYGFYTYIWAINIANAIGFIPYFWSAKKCINLSYSNQILTILKYFIPFLFLIYTHEYFYYYFDNSFFDLIIECSIYMVAYIGIAYCFKYSGLITCFNLIKQFINKRQNG